MRIFKALLFLYFFVFFTDSAAASESFYKANSDLRRVGLDEIREIAIIKTEAGNYRLDPDFRLGYGDTVAVNIWGKIEASNKITIDREGKIIIPFIGGVNIIGLTLEEAHSAVKRELDKKYTNVELDLALADVQDIHIAVLGNVENPGSYAVSPFCRIVEAIARAGGPKMEGSLSDIRLIRDGKQIASFNIYEFILKADQRRNSRLKHNDTIYIPQVKKLIAIRGEVMCPGIYEAGENSTLSEVIDTAGGIMPAQPKRKITVLRINPETGLTEAFREIMFEPSKGMGTKDDMVLENEDMVIVSPVSDSISCPADLFKVVHISGGINRPGDYLIKEGEGLNSLIRRAGGIKDTAFVQGAVFIRDSLKQKEKSVLEEPVRAQERIILEEQASLAEAILTQEEQEMRQKALEYRRKALSLMASRIPKGRIIIDLKQIIDNNSDIVLEAGDRIIIPPVPGWVMVTGAVYNPESIAFAEGKAIEYYLNAVGGATRLADKADIYIIKADGRTESKSTGYGGISRGDIIVVPEKME